MSGTHQSPFTGISRRDIGKPGPAQGDRGDPTAASVGQLLESSAAEMAQALDTCKARGMATF